jgi:hypothetical protein
MLTPQIFTIGDFVETWLKSNYENVFKDIWSDQCNHFIDKYNRNQCLYRFYGHLDDENKKLLINGILVNIKKYYFPQKLQKYTYESILNSILINRWVWGEHGVAGVYRIIDPSISDNQINNMPVPTDSFDFPKFLAMMPLNHKMVIINAYSPE